MRHTVKTAVAMDVRYKAELEYENEQANIRVKKELAIERRHGADEAVADLIARENCMKVNVKVSMWDNRTEEWYVCSEKIHYNPNYSGREYMLLCDGEHESTLTHTWCEAIVIHLKSKITFQINDIKVKFADEILESRGSLFFKFKYTDDYGKVYRFILYCGLMDLECTDERKEEIRKNILIPGAKWFCEHFREKFRMEREEDEWSKMYKRRKELKINE